MARVAKMIFDPPAEFPARSGVARARAARTCLAVLAALLLAPIGARAQNPPPVLTNAATVRALPPHGLREGRPVRLRGVITYRDYKWRFFIVQDDSGGTPVLARGSELPPAIGHRVEVEGVTTAFFGATGVGRATIRLLEMAALPEAKPTSFAEIHAGLHDGTRVEVAGVVSAAEVVEGRWLLHLHAGTNHLDVLVRDPAAADPALPRLVGATVRARGANCLGVLPGSERLQPYVLLAGTNQLLVTAPPSRPAFDGPATAIRDLPASNSPQRLKIIARVLSAPDSNGLCRVSDDTGALAVRASRAANVQPGDLAEIVGFPSVTSREAVFDHAVFRLLARPMPPAHAGTNAAASTNLLLPLIESIAEIRRLSPEDANRGHPVRVRGVVTFYDAGTQYLFIRDATHGIFVWPSDTNLSVRVSDIVEVSGFSGAGRYVPIIVSGRVRPVAAGELPPPRAVPFAELLTGRHDCDWVAMEGVVRSFNVWDDKLLFDVAASGGRFVAMVVSTNVAAAEALIDAEARFHGVCATDANNKRQLVGLKVLVPDMGKVMVLRPSPGDPFALPVRSVTSLFQFQPEATAGHRARVRGVVTMQRRPDTFFLRDDSGSLFVQLQEPQTVHPGDIVEAAGFPNVDGIVTSMQKAQARVVGRTNPPPARPVTVSRALADALDNEWIAVEARLLEVSTQGEQPVLVLESGRHVIEARFVRTNTMAAFKELRPGFLLRVEGVCQLQAEEGRAPRSIRLQCASPAGVTILQRTPWWTPRHALALGGGLAALVCAALAWAWLLRRQVRKQTSVIRDLNTGLERRVAERTADLEAANKELESFSYSVSHDLRAPLRAVNGFAEILLESHAPQLDEKASRYLRHVAEGGRRMDRLVGDLLEFSRLSRQPLAKAPLDLNALIPPILDELRRGDPQRAVAVEIQPLPPAEGDRALVQQALINLIANAWKFTALRPDARIEIGALTNGHGPVYFVRDNGAGFDMTYAEKLFGVFQRLHRDDEFPGTGVGLAIVQRIIHRHGGRVWAESRPGEGATFYFTLPAGSLKTEPCSAFGK